MSLSIKIQKKEKIENQWKIIKEVQEIKAIFKAINNLNTKDRDKLLAILETRREDISNIKDAIKFANNIDCFKLVVADDEEELARCLIYNGDIDIEDLMDYTDLNRLGQEYADDKNMKKNSTRIFKARI